MDITSEMRKRAQQRQFDIRKAMFLEAVELLIDLNEEDRDDLRYQKKEHGLHELDQEMLDGLERDDKELRALLSYLSTVDESILSWLFDTMFEDTTALCEKATARVMNE